MNLFRPSRLRFIKENYPLIHDQNAKILDVGGTLWPWTELNPAGELTILNISPSKIASPNPSWRFVKGDGTALQFEDKHFDLVFSNSVIEHVGNLDMQLLFAKEMMRCGKSIYLQTPNKFFFIEPHLIAPFMHWMPFSITRYLVRWFSVWGLVAKPSQEEIDDFLNHTRLLNENEIKELFPGCNIAKEMVLGMTKSFIVSSVD
jgi:ubiquinone/menaquinone biosynthesis C-methylase UbiE